MLNPGLLAAEILGIDSSDVLWRLDAAWSVPEGIVRAYDEEAAAAMEALFEEVAAALYEALDANGEPRGSWSERFTASPYIGRDDYSRLYFPDHGLLVTDLRSDLRAFSRFLRFAADHGLWLLIE